MINNSTNVIKKKGTATSHLKAFNKKKKKKNMPKYAHVNQGPGLGQAQKCDGVKPVNGSPTLPFLTI